MFASLLLLGAALWLFGPFFSLNPDRDLGASFCLLLIAGIVLGLGGVARTVQEWQRQQADAKSKADAQAAAEREAAAKKKEEIEEILRKYK